MPEDYCTPDMMIYSYNWKREYQNDAFLYSFDYSNYIYKYTDENSNSYTKVLAKSRYAEDNLMKAKTVDKTKECLAQYSNFVYDRYRDVYYRFFYPKVVFNNTESMFENGEFRKQFSIIIMDKDLNVIGETLFPENTYNPYMYFVAPEGLYISTNHIKNPDFDEDYLKFELFELKEM